MWDSAGLERYRALIPSYVRGASIIYILYDISSRDSFNNLAGWIKFIKEVNTDNSMIVLCGNKLDLVRQVSTKEGHDLANKENMIFFETSAKSGKNVNKMMYTCIAELPFFEQYNITDKKLLIQELENLNNKKEQNSIYDIVKDKNNEKVVGLNINDVQATATTIVPGQIGIKKRKGGCC